MHLPQNQCFSTLEDTKPGVFFTAGARKKLFQGEKVSPVVEFDQARFGVIRRENAARMSISGIQDKL